VTDYSNTVPPVGAGGGALSDGLGRRSLWAYHRWLSVATLSAPVLGVGLLVYGLWETRPRTPWQSLAGVGGVAVFVAWVPLCLVALKLRRRMQVRRRRGLCLKCGYPRPYQQAGICTECGTVPWWDDHEMAKS
jgi:hypothetical protein